MATDHVDQAKLKKLRLRIDTDDPLYLGMKKLKIRGKDLGNLPREVFHITELEVLDLSPEREACLYYRLSEIPPTIGRLINLQVLMLDTNELGDLPKEISLLSNLEKLSVSNNLLTVLPDLSSLRKLVSVHASNNQLVKFPMSVCALEDLRYLDLCDNQISELPDRISDMKQLETLLLFYNRIKELPNSICYMTNLRTLWIGANKIKTLPRHFGNLKNLDWGYRHTPSTTLDDNPLQHPPPEICRQGVQAIESYFNRAEASPTQASRRR